MKSTSPKWWFSVFCALIVFAAGYFYYNHLGRAGMSPATMSDGEPKTAVPGPFTADELNAYGAKESTATEKGKQQFISKCIACHGASGQGTVGPNLTDKFWLHGGKPHQIAQVIADGLPDKGMIAWKTIMSREEIMQVSIFVRSLQNSKPPGAKPPQGVAE